MDGRDTVAHWKLLRQGFGRCFSQWGRWRYLADLSNLCFFLLSCLTRSLRTSRLKAGLVITDCFQVSRVSKTRAYLLINSLFDKLGDLFPGTQGDSHLLQVLDCAQELKQCGKTTTCSCCHYSYTKRRWRITQKAWALFSHLNHCRCVILTKDSVSILSLSKVLLYSDKPRCSSIAESSSISSPSSLGSSSTAGAPTATFACGTGVKTYASYNNT